MDRWQYSLVALLLMLTLGMGATHATSNAYRLRFSDTPAPPQLVSQPHRLQVLNTPASMPDAPAALAESWLEKQGWKQIWPRWGLGDASQPMFVGPSAQRYLRLAADKAYYIWSHRVKLDPNRLRFLNITWGIERFPQQAALDVLGRNDRPIVVMVSFGDKLRSPGLRPNVPRALAFFWDETATVGASYTCIKPRLGDADVRMQCTYPHIKYIALRRGGANTVHTDHVDLVAHFRRHFPDYWQQHQRVPPIVAVSFEARSDRTASRSTARLYELAFTAKPPPHLSAWTPHAGDQSTPLTW